MVTINDMLARVESFNVVQAAGMAMENNKEQIIALNTNQIYEKSEDSEGVALRSPYSSRYAKYKQKVTGRTQTDLYLTGDFQSKFNLRVDGERYYILSSSEHAENVVKWANAPVYGLTVESQGEAWAIIYNDFVGEFCYQTGCKR